MVHNLRKSRARCLCGLRVSLHFTPDNRKLSCEEAASMHRYATVRRERFVCLLLAARKAVR